MYLPSFTSDNTPWFFNGMRLQIFPSDKLKIEPWLINGWQTYGKFNEMPGFGAQILYRPVEWLSDPVERLRRVGHAGQPGARRASTATTASSSATSTTTTRKYFTARRVLDHGRHRRRAGRRRDAVRRARTTDRHAARRARTPSPCEQHFLSWMAYHRDLVLRWPARVDVRRRHDAQPGAVSRARADRAWRRPYRSPSASRASSTAPPAQQAFSLEPGHDVQRLRLRDGLPVHARRAASRRTSSSTTARRTCPTSPATAA